MAAARNQAGPGTSLRDVLWAAQEGHCWICRSRMRRAGGNHPSSASIDHIWPKARYGEVGDIGVTLLACRECNARRGSPQPSDPEIRALVRVWRAVDRKWLRLSLKMIEADLVTLETRRKRAEILRTLVAS